MPEYSSRAKLHRKQGPPWQFEFDDDFEALVHRTRYGTLYLILEGISCGKPFWIGRYVKEANAIITVEDEIGVTEIEFDDGSSYFF